MPPSKPIVDPKWAGNFECSGPCQRKRLLGSEFSNKGLERHRKQGAALTCKQCQAKKEADERRASQRRAEAQKRAGGDDDGAAASTAAAEPVACASCGKDLPTSSFNRNQLSKGTGKARCRGCVEEAVRAEEGRSNSAKESKIEEARRAVEESDRKGDVAARIAAESVLAALEAEVVTGLKPIKLGRGRGRKGGGRGRGGSGGRGSTTPGGRG